MTDRTKTICPPIFDLGGIKISENNVKSLNMSVIIKRQEYNLIQKQVPVFGDEMQCKQHKKGLNEHSILMVHTKQ